MEQDLFQLGKFKSHSGLELSWKIECDALGEDEWDCIAQMILEHERTPFRTVVGIPRGGEMLARKLQRYATGESRHPILLVDDVLTTGTSFREFIKEHHNNKSDEVLCWVVFARESCPPSIKALFQMPKIRKI